MVNETKQNVKIDISNLSVDAAENFWRAYRRKVRKGHFEPVVNPDLIRAMFSAMIRNAGKDYFTKKKGVSIADQLRGDKALMEYDLWQLFEFTAFPKGWTLTSWDAHFAWIKNDREGEGEDWKGTICELAHNGEIPKERVIDGCFQSLKRPFTDFEAKWYVNLLEQLIDRLPITDEDMKNDQRFLELLDHPNPTPCSLGFAIMERLFKVGKIEENDIVQRSVQLFRNQPKGKIKKLLAMLEKIAKKSIEQRPVIFSSILEALQHESAEIQQASLDFLLKYDAINDTAILEKVRKIMPSLSAVVRKQIPRDQEPKSEPTAKAKVVAASKPVPAKIVREPIVPIKDMEELLDVASHLIEKATDADEIERFLDGLSRLGTQKDADFEKKSAPILKRGLHLLGSKKDYHDAKNFHLAKPVTLPGKYLVHDLFILILTWLAGEGPLFKCVIRPAGTAKFNMHADKEVYEELLEFCGKTWLCHRSFHNNIPKFPAHTKEDVLLLTNLVFHKYVGAIIMRVLESSSTNQLLSAPTHRGGWIAPEVFAKRLIQSHENKAVHGEHERVLALLRLDTNNRDAALKLIDKSIAKPDEYCQAARYALGACGVKIGKTAHYWIAAARCRNPYESDPAVEKTFPDYGPDAGTAATYLTQKSGTNTIQVKSLPEMKVNEVDLTLFPTVALHDPYENNYIYYEEGHDWRLTIWPQNSDPAIATTLQMYTCEGLDSPRSVGFKSFITVMQRGDARITPIGVKTMLTALAMKCPANQTAALDTLIISIGDGRLTAKMFAEEIRELYAFKLLTVSRWAKSFHTVAEQSDHHAETVRNALEICIHTFDTKDTRTFMEFFFELCVKFETPITNPACRHFLESQTGTGKAAKLAKKLLEI